MTHDEQIQQLQKEIELLKEVLYQKSNVLREKDKTITNLYKQIDLLMSFIPEKGT